jgi:hypothetical protein
MKKNKDQIKSEIEETKTDSLGENSLDQDSDIADPAAEVKLDDDGLIEDQVEVLRAALGEMTAKAEEYLAGSEPGLTLPTIKKGCCGKILRFDR